ncbi:hypothetical protein PM082_007184 [Marasmius tenuissimus]|nr:hypothetical protein PM082_007184 [Marasmius tenuissimus]
MAAHSTIQSIDFIRDDRPESLVLLTRHGSANARSRINESPLLQISGSTNKPTPSTLPVHYELDVPRIANDLDSQFRPEKLKEYSDCFAQVVKMTSPEDLIRYTGEPSYLLLDTLAAKLRPWFFAGSQPARKSLPSSLN